MPAITPTPSRQPKILVTGTTGYIAPWVIQYLLADGFHVRAVVRDLSSSKVAAVSEHFKAHVDRGAVEFCVVEDFLKEHAFDEAVRDVDGIVHLASPVGGSATSGEAPKAEDFIKPAKQGTLNVLKSISPSSPVKRVVYTSSTSAISRYPLTSPNNVFTESDWGRDPEVLEEQGESASGFVKYRASKTLAERAAWDYSRGTGKGDGESKDHTWDLTVLNPPFVIGPGLIPALPIGIAVQWWFDLVIKGSSDTSTDATKESTAQALRGSCPYVDVRDVARAHVEALKREDAGGERVIVSGGTVGWQEAIEHLSSLEDLPALKTPFTKGLPDLDKSQVTRISYDNSKSKSVLGMEYREYETTVRDMLKDLSKRGL